MPSIREIIFIMLRMTSSNVPPVLYMCGQVLYSFLALDFAFQYCTYYSMFHIFWYMCCTITQYEYEYYDEVAVGDGQLPA
jgi:hypothetical protein